MFTIALNLMRYSSVHKTLGSSCKQSKSEQCAFDHELQLGGVRGRQPVRGGTRKSGLASPRTTSSSSYSACLKSRCVACFGHLARCQFEKQLRCLLWPVASLRSRPVASLKSRCVACIGHLARCQFEKQVGACPWERCLIEQQTLGLCRKQGHRTFCSLSTMQVEVSHGPT